jgi:hypothetical protein
MRRWRKSPPLDCGPATRSPELRRVHLAEGSRGRNRRLHREERARFARIPTRVLLACILLACSFDAITGGTQLAMIRSGIVTSDSRLDLAQYQSPSTFYKYVIGRSTFYKCVIGRCRCRYKPRDIGFHMGTSV